MARKPLRSQLNQIRAWVRQGRTDAWIAHQLDVSASELREFRRRHELAPEDETGEVELRDEIEAEIEALSEAEVEDEDEEDEEEADEAAAAGADEAETAEKADGEPTPGRRRRRRRRRGGGGRPGAAMQGTFDQGDTDGYGLWLDPTIADDPVYTEHWAGHRRVEVTVEPDRIVIKRSDG
jgi:hypothetical protein